MFLLDIRIRYILLSILVYLNFLHYFYNPLKYSNSNKCFGIDCRKFTLLGNLLSFSFLSAMIICMANLNPSIFFPNNWFGPVIIFGYTVIILDWKNSDIIVPRKGRITPPPLDYLPKIRRNIALFFSLVIYLILFICNFVGDRVSVNSNSLSDILFWSAFGGYKNNKTSFFCGWISIFGLVNGIINMNLSENFHPQIYNLPNSWRI